MFPRWSGLTQDNQTKQRPTSLKPYGNGAGQIIGIVGGMPRILGSRNSVENLPSTLAQENTVLEPVEKGLLCGSLAT